MRIPNTMMIPLLAGALVGCDTASGPNDGGGTVTLKFTMAPGSASMQQTASGLSLAIAALPIDGTNGTLTLDEIRLVVNDIRLESVSDTCGGEWGDHDDDDMSESRVSLHGGHPGMDEDGEDHDGDGCEAVALDPFFVSVPLEGAGTGEIGVEVVPGTYSEITLRTGAPDGSTDADLLAAIRAEFLNWPENASMLVVGSFTPTDGDPVPFSVYFDARIKVEQEFEDDPLVVEEGGNLTITVTIDPMTWFMNADGTVDDLSVHDFATTGEVVPFDFKSGEGCRIERERD